MFNEHFKFCLTDLDTVREHRESVMEGIERVVVDRDEVPKNNEETGKPDDEGKDQPTSNTFEVSEIESQERVQELMQTETSQLQIEPIQRTRRAWSKNELSALERVFHREITEGRIPSSAGIRKLQDLNKSLATRTIPQIRARMQYLISKKG